METPISTPIPPHLTHDIDDLINTRLKATKVAKERDTDPSDRDASLFHWVLESPIELGGPSDPTLTGNVIQSDLTSLFEYHNRLNQVPIPTDEGATDVAPENTDTSQLSDRRSPTQKQQPSSLVPPHLRINDAHLERFAANRNDLHLVLDRFAASGVASASSTHAPSAHPSSSSAPTSGAQRRGHEPVDTRFHPEVARRHVDAGSGISEDPYQTIRDEFSTVGVAATCQTVTVLPKLVQPSYPQFKPNPPAMEEHTRRVITENIFETVRMLFTCVAEIIELGPDASAIAAAGALRRTEWEDEEEDETESDDDPMMGRENAECDEGDNDASGIDEEGCVENVDDDKVDDGGGGDQVDGVSGGMASQACGSDGIVEVNDETQTLANGKSVQSQFDNGPRQQLLTKRLIQLKRQMVSSLTHTPPHTFVHHLSVPPEHSPHRLPPVESSLDSTQCDALGIPYKKLERAHLHSRHFTEHLTPLPFDPHHNMSHMIHPMGYSSPATAHDTSQDPSRYAVPPLSPSTSYFPPPFSMGPVGHHLDVQSPSQTRTSLAPPPPSVLSPPTGSHSGAGGSPQPPPVKRRPGRPPKHPRPPVGSAMQPQQSAYMKKKYGLIVREDPQPPTPSASSSHHTSTPTAHHRSHGHHHPPYSSHSQHYMPYYPPGGYYPPPFVGPGPFGTNYGPTNGMVGVPPGLPMGGLNPLTVPTMMMSSHPGAPGGVPMGQPGQEFGFTQVIDGREWAPSPPAGMGYGVIPQQGGWEWR
eukprot:GHVN01096072.1.p1 GENE.GHVN01096072.1~~GHVN01096072.1.p1  ORF type:complete len:755 (+),score=166.26 GHVN01096072.1:308-2572(+)